MPCSDDWLTEQEWAEWAASRQAREEEPPEDDEEPDPEDPALPAEADLDAIAAECREMAAEQAEAAANAARLGTTGALAAIGAMLGRRGPGQPGSAYRFPGTYTGPAGGFATGQPLDIAPGGSGLLGHAEYAAGNDDRFTGSSDDELLGVICGLDRVEATAASLRHAAVAELIRRRPDRDCTPQGPAQMPEAWDESIVAELSYALAETRNAAETMLERAWDLEVKLPGTKAAFRSGVLRQSKAEVISRATTVLDPDEARAAEALVLGRAGRLSPSGLRAAIARAVVEVAPEKAKKRREQGEKDARVERWPEDSGNASLAGRELPPADVLAADQRITWWAMRLREAGLEGDMDQLRARAYLDILLDKDSRPIRPENGNSGGSPDGGNGPDSGGGDGPGGPGDGGPGPSAPPEPRAPGTGVVPSGYVGCINLTTPLTTLLELAERPGEIPGIGPVDPALARDLAHAAARNPKTTYCVTVTDQQGHAVGHGCARPEPRNHNRTAGHERPKSPGDHDPPGDPGSEPRPGFTFTASDQEGPPGGYGVWRLRTGIPGRPDLLIVLDPIAVDTCDHRFEARGHDPGVKLRHLSQIRHATCTGPTCRRPSVTCDFEHNIPYETGGRSCLCNTGPKCRREHRLKQDPRWKVEQITPAVFRWTTPSGRRYTTEATTYPI